MMSTSPSRFTSPVSLTVSAALVSTARSSGALGIGNGECVFRKCHITDKDHVFRQIDTVSRFLCISHANTGMKVAKNVTKGKVGNNFDGIRQRNLTQFRQCLIQPLEGVGSNDLDGLSADLLRDSQNGSIRRKGIEIRDALEHRIVHEIFIDAAAFRCHDANTVQDIEREMKDFVVDMQKQVTEAYENEQNKRYQALKDNLKKEQDALNKAYEEESYQKGLNEQQRALDEIAQQIAIYSRDGSEAGKARLEQLKKEYEAQQEAINEMIRENEKKLSDERFAEEETKLDDELAEILAPENLVAAVNEAITSGMVTVGDEVIKLSDLMSDWMNESGDGLYALGGVIKEELIANLEAAAELMRETGILGVSDVSSRLKSINESRDSGSTVNFNQPLVFVESMSADTDLEAFATTIKNEVYGAINEALR